MNFSAFLSAIARRAALLLLLGTASLPALAAKTVLVFGDSLSAGYGIRQDAAWPALLGQRLASQRPDYSVANLSISGETTAGGRSRLPAALEKHHPAVVVLALGANDGLRGLPLPAMRDNLAAMIDAARTQGARVVLVGMRLPPNYGAYAREFEEAFAKVAQQKKVPLAPFLLEGIADRPVLFQADALHPTADAQPAILDTVWKVLAGVLR
jgi:acyl-CoA thioesterase-1